MSSSSVESSQVHQICEENLALCQKILQQENAIKSLKCKYENAVDDSEEAHNVNKKLDDEIQTLRSTIANQSVKIEDSRVADFEKYLLEKQKQIEDIINQNKNYKIEIRNINFKNEKFIIENRNIKNEKEWKRKQLCCLESSKERSQRKWKKHNVEIKTLEKEIKKISDYKQLHVAEEKQFRKKQKKIKKKKEITIAAEIEVKKFTEERNIKEEMGTAIQLNPYSNPIVNENSYTCPHVPQCILRGPRSPPLGPKNP